jgi:ribosomal protein S18 acetylase RimI-like enzyme
MTFLKDIRIIFAKPSDLKEIVNFMQPMYAATYPNDRGIEREMFENNTFREHLSNYLEEKLLEPDCCLLTARLSGEIVGTIGLAAHPDNLNQAELWGFYVASNLQGKGIGRRLWAELMRQIKTKNYSSLILNVAKDTPNSLRFYKRNNFVIIDEIEKDWPSWTGEHLVNQYWIMQKKI